MEISIITVDGSDNLNADSVSQEVETPPVEESIALNMPRRKIRSQDVTQTIWLMHFQYKMMASREFQRSNQKL